jgi:ribonucleoside-diphosphate reductase alpha chain
MASSKVTWHDLAIPAEKAVSITDNARVVLERRYFAKDEKGDPIENAEGMFSRIARYIAFADSLYGATKEEMNTTAVDFYNIMTDLDFIPNSPTLMNAGRPLGQLSACFVLPVEDSIDKIFDAVKQMALIHKSGGGTGFSFSRLRPKNDTVRTTAGVSSGPVSFISIFNSATETIKQGGTRRGANMAILNIDHPDILEFISSKENTSALTNFNISVGITEEFMKAVDEDGEYALRNPRSGEEEGRLSAKHVFRLIVKMAWKNGEPGIVFLDRINEKNPLRDVGMIESTNPCGEQPLLPYESCNLGSINLSRMIEQKNGKCVIDYERLAEVAGKAVHFLDNVIDVNNYPLKEIEENTKANRKIGLGVMGFADLLIRLGVPYGSDEGIRIAHEIMSFIQKIADDASEKLAIERGTFPNYEKSVYAAHGKKLRNATRTTIAPTGTISIIANASSGIEPLFALAYTRNVMDGTKLIEVNPVFRNIMNSRGLYSDSLMDRIAAAGTVAHIDEIPDDLKSVLQTAHDISPEWHIRMQAAFQTHTDNAVSKTVNFPSSATEEDIEKVYRLAYELGCKGVTVYRDGSREGQVLQINTEKIKKKELTAASDNDSITQQYLSPKKRGELTWGATRKMTTGCGSLYVTMNRDEDGLFEVFAVMGKSGGCAASQTEAISRLISLGLRCGVDPDQIIKQVKGVRCPNQAWERGGRIYSCADAIAKALEKYIHADTRYSENSSEMAKNLAETNGKGGDAAMVGVCPECHGPLEHEAGCSVCKSCGFSRCG